MFMSKEKNRKSVKSLIVGSLVIVGLCFLGCDISLGNTNQNEIKDFKDFIMDEHQLLNIADSTLALKSESVSNIKEDYIATIEIPKIKLKTIMYDIDSKNNTVDKHIQILNGSTMPNIEKGNFILASHSGTSNISYFKHLNKLKLNDEVFIEYHDKKYTYIVYDIYTLDKDGTIEIKRDSEKTMLTLTTCDTTDDTKQLVVLASKINTTNLK